MRFPSAAGPINTYGLMTKEGKLLGLLAPIDLQVKENKATVSELEESMANSPHALVMAPCNSE